MNFWEIYRCTLSVDAQWEPRKFHLRQLRLMRILELKPAQIRQKYFVCVKIQLRPFQQDTTAGTKQFLFILELCRNKVSSSKFRTLFWILVSWELFIYSKISLLRHSSRILPCYLEFECRGRLEHGKVLEYQYVFQKNIKLIFL